MFFSQISLVACVALALLLNTSSVHRVNAQNQVKPDDFVYLTDYVDDAILDIRYFSSYNFVGEKIDGYLAPKPMLTKPAAEALAKAAKELRAQGYRIIVYDTYRPTKAVRHFIRFCEKDENPGMKAEFFPRYEKNQLIPMGFISKKSGHSRGSTIDLGLVTMNSELVDMGGAFDYFDDVSYTNYPNLTEAQKKNRAILRNAMLSAGFRGIKEEWWHFTLKGEPYPYKYFDFDVE